MCPSRKLEKCFKLLAEKSTKEKAIIFINTALKTFLTSKKLAGGQYLEDNYTEMKFGKTLTSMIELSDPEWGPYWINYKFMKKKMALCQKKPFYAQKNDFMKNIYERKNENIYKVNISYDFSFDVNKEYIIKNNNKEYIIPSLPYNVKNWESFHCCW